MPLKNRIDFMIVGAQKCGTSALDYYLRNNPHIQMAHSKECHFFSTDSRFNNNPQYDFYHNTFFNLNSNCVIGEATPIYMYWSESMKRIYQYNSKIKLIVMLRNPIERAFSAWNMEQERGRESKPFSYAIRNEQARSSAALPKQHKQYSYTDRGFYSEQLRRIWRYFPKKQVLVLKYEDFKSNNLKYLNVVNSFLGVQTLNHLSEKQVNTSFQKQQMKKEDRDFLFNLYEFEIKQIEKMLDWDCSDWK